MLYICRFPVSDKQLLQRWIQNVAPDNFKPAPQDVICSLHFTDDQFLDTLPRTLIKCALPTLLFIDNKYISSVPENCKMLTTTSVHIKLYFSTFLYFTQESFNK